MMIPVGTTAVTVLVYKLYKYLFPSPQKVYFAALKDVKDPSLKVTLFCLANHKQGEIDKLTGE
jgi:hypothetical protein